MSGVATVLTDIGSFAAGRHRFGGLGVFTDCS